MSAEYDMRPQVVDPISHQAMPAVHIWGDPRDSSLPCGEGFSRMSSRVCLLVPWVASIVLVAGSCGTDSSLAGAEGSAAARFVVEPTAEARAALTAGAGSVGNCNGNPA